MPDVFRPRPERRPIWRVIQETHREKQKRAERLLEKQERAHQEERRRVEARHRRIMAELGWGEKE